MWFSWRLHLGADRTQVHQPISHQRAEEVRLGPWEAEAVLLVRQRLEVGIDGSCLVPRKLLC